MKAWTRWMRWWCPVAALLISTTTALGVSSSNAGEDVFSGININQFLGAERFYDLGFFGDLTIVANIEGGHLWDQHSTLGHASAFFNHGTVDTTPQNHATGTAFTMAGRAGVYPTHYFANGMAPNATLWSGAIATSFHATNGTFNTNFTTEAYAYVTALQTGIGGLTADVINSSWGFTEPFGVDRTTMGVDALLKATGKIGVFSAGNNGPATNTVGGIAAGYNGISVAALTSDTDTQPYNQVASFSSRGPNGFAFATSPNTWGDAGQIRAAVDIAAPGTNLTVAAYAPNYQPPADRPFVYQTNVSGTSYAAPLVAGGAALLVDFGREVFADQYNAGPNRAIDGRVIKAVLLNSADKTAGWNNGQALNITTGVIETTQSLDWAVGAGRMNLDRAFDQYVPTSLGGAAGTVDAPDFDDNTGILVAATGWDFGQIGLGSEKYYLINDPLVGGSAFTSTLTWFVDRATGSLTDFNGSAEVRFADLNLFLFTWEMTGPSAFDILDVVAGSISAANAVEHLHLELPGDGLYGLGVTYADDMWNFDELNLTSEVFGLAWSGSVIPEPTTILLLIVLLLAALARRRMAL